MKQNIKVEWIEHNLVILPEKYNPFPTQEDYDVYNEALKKAKIKHQGEIIEFVNTFFGGTKAIIEGTDRKIYKININNLTIIKNYD